MAAWDVTRYKRSEPTDRLSNLNIPSALSTKNLRIDDFDAAATVSRPWLVFSEAVKWA